MSTTAILIPRALLEEICRKYSVRELALFGSALNDDFGPDSDIDLLVEFDPIAEVGFLTLGRLQRELAALLGRRVDLVPRQGLKPVIKQAILARTEIIYAA